VDPGSESGRDDYGLPPVDIEIPDDARDLDRDVQAYYRELRVLRRRSRLQRVTGPLVRRGLIIPIVAICLAVTLVAGTLFTVRAGRLMPLASGRPTPGTGQRPASATTAGAVLPNIPVLLDGNQVSLRKLAPAVLTWVPPGCSCGLVLSRLAQQAKDAGVEIYFVGAGIPAPELSKLADQAAPGGSSRIVDDIHNILASTYHLSSLSAVLAHSDYSVRAGDVLKRLSLTAQLEAQFRSIATTASQSPTLPPTATASLKATPQNS
jgi:hypothetical protein